MPSVSFKAAVDRAVHEATAPLEEALRDRLGDIRSLSTEIGAARDALEQSQQLLRDAKADAARLEREKKTLQEYQEHLERNNNAHVASLEEGRRRAKEADALVESMREMVSRSDMRAFGLEAHVARLEGFIDGRLLPPGDERPREENMIVEPGTRPDRQHAHRQDFQPTKPWTDMSSRFGRQSRGG